MPTQNTYITNEFVPTAIYLIRNACWPRYVQLSDANDGSEVVGGLEEEVKKKKKTQWWKVVDLGNGNHSVMNHDSTMYASSRFRPSEGDAIVGLSVRRQFKITAQTPDGRYTIGLTDVPLYWGLSDKRTGTPVQLHEEPNQEANQWLFIRVAEIALPTPRKPHITGKCIQTGTYLVQNVYSKNYLALADPNDGSQVVSAVYGTEATHVWNVLYYEDDEYSLQNEGSANYAKSRFQAENGDEVVGRASEQVWRITESTQNGVYAIGLVEDELYWGLSDREIGTPVYLCENPQFEGNQWFFIPVN